VAKKPSQPQTASFQVWTTVSPSPRDLVNRLDPGERVAVDLILERNFDAITSDGGSAHVDEPLFIQLVPDRQRRGYLITLTRQLRALGITLHDHVTEREVP
jgi:hypothetical protein